MPKKKIHENIGRRPADGSFPACPMSGICKAQSIRTHEACKNCALTNESLEDAIAKQGTDRELKQKIVENCPECVDLLTRLVDARKGTQDAPCFHEIVLDIYHLFGGGNIAPRYLGKALQAPRPQDEAHARMIMEEVGFTCYQFNRESEKCFYVEDYVYCKRHTPVFTMAKLKKCFTKFERMTNRKRKHNVGKGSYISISDIKEKILKHEKSMQEKFNVVKFKEIPLRKRFNKWLKHMNV